MTLSTRSGTLGGPEVLGRTRLRFASRLRSWVATRFQHLARVVRARAVPAVAAAKLAFERGERVLSVGHGPDDGCALVATDRALYYRSGGDGWSRLGWEEISRVGWDAAAGRLLVIAFSGAAPARIVVPLRRRGTVPELAAERVSHSRLGRWDLLVAGARRVLVEARRRPGTGELLWVVLSGDCDAGEIRGAIARLGADLGIAQLPRAGVSLAVERADLDSGSLRTL
jgi:hypothetical protein